MSLRFFHSATLPCLKNTGLSGWTTKITEIFLPGNAFLQPAWSGDQPQ